jgi:ferredoxin
MHIEAERDDCIAAGNCVMVAGDLFDQDDDGIVVAPEGEISAADEDKAREAVTLCPASALKLA